MLTGAPTVAALLLVPALLLPILASRRPPAAVPVPAALALALAAGALHAGARERTLARDCRLLLEEGSALAVRGRIESGTVRGRLTLEVEEGAGPACRGPIGAFLPRAVERGLGAETSGLGRGVSVLVRGSWRRSPGARDPERAGDLVVSSMEILDDRRPGSLAARRAFLDTRVAALWPERGGVVAALILARREGLDASLRDAFARAGTAHLLAISGFHVGVVAALLLGALRGVGLPRRPAGVGAALAVWLYVLFIGAPDAASRAAVILTLFAAGALGGRPVSGTGALSAGLLLLVAADAGALARPGFQLSFAGAGGLVLWGRPLERRLRALAPHERAGPFLSALAAGLAATVATLPIVAWHFDRVSLVGIPATMVSTPLVAAAIPGAFAALALDAVSPGVARFVAGGVDLLLVALLGVTRRLADLPWAVAFVPRIWVLAACLGAVIAALALSRARRVGGAVRALALAGGAAATIVLLPAWGRATALGSVEIHVLDVGQGDAVLVRSPRSHWVLVDAGPPPPPGRSGEPRVLDHLRQLGVRRLEALVLTHPHLDHVGGAPAVLDAFPVGVVVDPGLASGSDGFLRTLEAAAREGAGWRAARRGDRLEVDGLVLEVLHELDLSRGPPDDANESSVVVLVRFGEFEALLTGDAPAAVEEDAVLRSGPFEVLKVGHHGSRTSTSGRFLDASGPSAAVISLGRGNRYGHPHDEVLERLDDAGVLVYRTDRDGSVRVRARWDGSFAVDLARGERAGTSPPRN